MSLRACDSCRRRKVRCDRGTPCRQCDQARLPCTYEHNTSRFRLIQPKDDCEEPGSPSSGTFSLPSSPTFGHQWFLTPDLVEKSISVFFTTLYSVMPVLNRTWIRERAAEIHSSSESYCLLGALCALTLIRCGLTMPTGFNHHNPHASPSSKTQASQSHGSRLLQDLTFKRESLNYRQNPTTAALLTSFLIYVIYSDLGNEQKAAKHLNEAVEMAQNMGIHDENSYSDPETTVEKINRRLFWVLYVAERTQAIQSHTMPVLEESIAFPRPEASNPNEFRVLMHLVALYSVSDRSFLQTWNDENVQTAIQPTQATENWLVQLRSQIKSAVPQAPAVQTVDLEVRVTQIWLRFVVWQLTISHGTLMRSAPDEAMHLDYPVVLAAQLFKLTSDITFESLEMRGVGFARKLFDVAGAVLDVLSTIMFSVDASSRIHNHLNHIQTLIEAVNPNQCRYKDLLRERLAEAHIAFANGQVLGLSTNCLAHVSSPEVATFERDLVCGVEGEFL